MILLSIITLDRDRCMIVRDDVPAVAKAALLCAAGSHQHMPVRVLPDVGLLAIYKTVIGHPA
jgi:hypothetical protein